MSVLLNIRWTPELRDALVKWLLDEGQIRIEPADQCTPEMMMMAVKHRSVAAQRAVHKLRCLLEGQQVTTLDLDILLAVEDLRDRLALPEGGR